MNLAEHDSISKLRDAIQEQIDKIQRLLHKITDKDEWAKMNDLRWEFMDIQGAISEAGFLKNNDELKKLIKQVNSSSSDAKRLVTAIDDARNALKTAKEALHTASSIYMELSSFYEEAEELINIMRGEG